LGAGEGRSLSGVFCFANSFFGIVLTTTMQN
jgi:hypothetical protein